MRREFNRCNAAAEPPISACFSLMVKPIGPICNLECAYCYYREKESLYRSDEAWRMPDAVLVQLVSQYLQSQVLAPEATLVWQGGEPALVGLRFFERAVALEQRFARPGQQIVNVFQTNGTLLDEAWCTFLAERRFLVGLSLDGPSDVHDPLRHTRSGEPTARAVEESLGRLNRHGAAVNAMCAVHRRNEDQPERVYSFFKDRGVGFIHFLPVVVREGSEQRISAELSVTPEGWGRFLIGAFDAWLAHDVGRVFVPFFDAALAGLIGAPPVSCAHAQVCGRALIAEHNGDIYSCDHFVAPQHKLGNALETPLAVLADSPAQRAFAEAKRDFRQDDCRNCAYDAMCRGGCPKDRVQLADKSPNYLCAGYKSFFEHALPALSRMAAALAQGLPAFSAVKE